MPPPFFVSTYRRRRAAAEEKEQHERRDLSWGLGNLGDVASKVVSSGQDLVEDTWENMETETAEMLQKITGVVDRALKGDTAGILTDVRTGGRQTRPITSLFVHLSFSCLPSHPLIG